MAELEGNVLRPPGVGPEIRTDDVEELLASTVGYTQKGGTLEADATGGQNGDGVLEVGTPLKFNATSGYWEEATVTAGTPVAGSVEGFLRNAVDIANEDKLINIVVKGTIKLAVRGLEGIDGDDLAGSITGARVIPAYGWLTF